MDQDVIVIGSGPGGTSAALAASANGHRVLLLERGSHMPKAQGNGKIFTFGTTINWLLRIKDNAPFAVGGGSAINYGLFVVPTRDDISRAMGIKNAGRLLQVFPKYMHAIVAKVVKPTTAMSIAKDVSLRAANVWNLNVAVDQAGSATESSPRETNRNTVLYPGGLQRMYADRIDFSMLATDVRNNIRLISDCEVTLLQEIDVGFVVHVKHQITKERMSFRAPHVVVACGALETPRLLLHSVAQGGLPKGVSPHVGRHLLDHGRHQLVFKVDAFDNRHPFVNPLLSQTKNNLDTHIDFIVSEGIQSLQNLLIPVLNKIGTSKVIRILERYCPIRTVDPSWDTDSFDCCCLAPCGLSSACNPLRFLNKTMLVIVGAEYSNEGSVTIREDGSRVTKYPTFKREDTRTLQSQVDEFTNICNQSWNVRQASRNVLAHGEADTEWHHVGTCRMSENEDDGAVGSDFVLRDALNQPYAGKQKSLRIGDNSVARRPSVHNTQSLAALIGFASGNQIFPSSPLPSEMKR